MLAWTEGGNPSNRALSSKVVPSRVCNHSSKFVYDVDQRIMIEKTCELLGGRVYSIVCVDITWSLYWLSERFKTVDTCSSLTSSRKSATAVISKFVPG